MCYSAGLLYHTSTYRLSSSCSSSASSGGAPLAEHSHLHQLTHFDRSCALCHPGSTSLPMPVRWETTDGHMQSTHMYPDMGQLGRCGQTDAAFLIIQNITIYHHCASLRARNNNTDAIIYT